MQDETKFSLHPVNFFALSADCHKLKDIKQSPHPLPDTRHLCFEIAFAKVAMGWHEEGIALQVQVNQPFTHSQFPELMQGDSIELFFDTRDMKSAGFNTRFCHHFFFLPKAADDKLAGEITHFRTEDSHPLCDPALLQCQTKFGLKNYIMSIFIPSECLHGYDPKQFDRLGFTYRINRVGDDPQHFSVVSQEFPIEQQPSLWSSLKLIDTEAAK